MVTRPLILLLILLVAGSLQAQPAQVEYTVALRYMEARNYEAALPILERLNRQDATNYPVFDRLITCLIELKRYPEAIDRLEKRVDRRYRDIVTAVKLGEVHHIAGDTTKAREAWRRTIESNAQDLNAYRYVAETMTNRRDHLAANAVYALARQRFNSPDLFVMEVASNAINAGNPTEGVREFIRFAEQNPQSSAVILRQILRFGDPELNDLAILELQERGLTQRAHHELNIGLLMEQGYLRRAYQAARAYELTAPEGQFPLHGLASRLRAQGEFDLAAQAYGHYTAIQRHSLRPDAMVELARTRINQADVLVVQNLDTEARMRALMSEADSILKIFSNDYGNHPRLTEAWLMHAELRLDHHRPTDIITGYIERLLKTPSNTDSYSAAEYLQGRLFLKDGNFAQARVSFTRSNRAVRTGDRAELTRYFLALTDFYAGDFEFSRLQMRALERMSTSIYANDAIQLRRWLTEGTADDTTGATIRGFATGLFHAARGDSSKAWDQFTALLGSDASDGLKAESLTLAIRLKRQSDPEKTLALIDTWMPRIASNPARETHLWLKARIFDSQNRKTDAISMYIHLLEQFPNGFYADVVRNRVRNLTLPS